MRRETYTPCFRVNNCLLTTLLSVCLTDSSDVSLLLSGGELNTSETCALFRSCSDHAVIHRLKQTAINHSTQLLSFCLFLLLDILNREYTAAVGLCSYLLNIRLNFTFKSKWVLSVFPPRRDNCCQL